ncbi:MAG: hypothetical protein GY716_19865 [bacterium]|nr:hypothetical protein [bacterium]
MKSLLTLALGGAMLGWTCAPLAASGPGGPGTGPVIWALNQTSENIAVVDVGLDSVLQTIALPNPADPGKSAPPWCLAFSSVAGQAGQIAFVTQGRWIRVVSVSSGSVIATVDLAAPLGLADVELRGCSAAAPRDFANVAGPPATKSLLHVAANAPGGTPMFVVLDQAALTAGTTAIVGSGALAASGTALDVQVLGAPQGERFQRAWYSVLHPGPNTQVAPVLVTTGVASGAPWTVAARPGVLIPSVPLAPEVLRPGAPRDREFPVFPGGGAGTLRNVYSDLGCSIGGEIVAASVAGTGPKSYTVFALDRAGSTLHVVDPNTCLSTPFTVGTTPVSVTTLGRVVWRQAFVANFGSSDISVLYQDGTLKTIPLLPIHLGTIGIGVPAQQECTISDLKVQTVAADVDLVPNDLEVSWDAGGCPGPFEISCFCQDSEPDCPCGGCFCPTDEEGCVCPGLGFAGSSFAMGGPGIILFPQDIGDDPWKMLGDAPSSPFLHHDQVGKQASWWYVVEFGP